MYVRSKNAESTVQLAPQKLKFMRCVSQAATPIPLPAPRLLTLASRIPLGAVGAKSDGATS